MIKNKKILVTGGAGTVGSNIVKKLVEKEAEVTVIDNLDAYPFDYLHEYGVGNLEKVKFVKESITDHEIIGNLIKEQDIVIHAAALADVGACIRNPETEFKTNVAATQNILEQCKKNNIEKFIFISSAAVYGLGNRSIFKETDACFPVSNYALSKYWGEQQTKLYYELYNLPTTSIRFFSVYGSPQIPKKGSHSWAVAIFGALAKKGKPITVFGDGNQVRDFTHVSDIAESVVLSTEKESTNGKFFNVGTGKPTKINDIVEKIFQHVKPVPINYKPYPPGDPIGGHADTTLMKKLLDWEPEIKLDQGIEEYFDWLSNHEHIIPKWI
jgi:nucleoside-diphosphate-sugar epimerase|tara:strand:- start:2282 stop:3259 length:978 start_codon:yes stop_codon:yes gene_type:complete